MKNIDFLPAKYHQQDEVRKRNVWRLLLVVMFGGVVAFAALYQLGMRRHVYWQLDQVVAAHAAAQSKIDHLSRMRSDLHEVNAAADLYVYLQHGWPRTQVLAAIIEPLPDSVTLWEVRIGRETPAASATPGGRFRRQRREEKESDDLAKLLPAERDLKLLRDQFDQNHLVVYLSGMTRAAGPVHEYLARLEKSPLFVKAEVGSIDNKENAKLSGALEFNARLLIRPGYGQPSGPQEDRPQDTPPERIGDRRSTR